MASGVSSPAVSVASSGSVKGLALLNPSNILSSTSATPSTNVSRKVICVFCGASPGNSPAHMEAARLLAQTFHENNISLVYGGGTVGLMGEIARTLVSLSGPDSVHGIIPAPLVKYERGPESTTVSEALPDVRVYGNTTVVKDMHTRKQLMARQVLLGAPGSGFLALSGGYGTLEELMEVVTWNQLGIHDRGVVVYNVEGYWDGLLKWVQGAVGAGFVGIGTSGIIAEAKTAEECVELLAHYHRGERGFKLEWGNE